MKTILRAVIFLLCTNAFSIFAMGKDEKFMTSKTHRLVTISEYQPDEDGQLFSIAEWETRWGNIKNFLEVKRNSDAQDNCSETLAASADPIKLSSPRGKTPPLPQIEALKSSLKKDS